IRTCDLEVMSLASYRAAPPRVSCRSILPHDGRLANGGLAAIQNARGPVGTAGSFKGAGAGGGESSSWRRKPVGGFKGGGGKGALGGLLAGGFNTGTGNVLGCDPAGGYGGGGGDSGAA